MTRMATIAAPVGQDPVNLLETFAISTASIPGGEHLRLGRNNQDGIATRTSRDLLIAVVTDGCSSGRSCEVGARLGAAWLVEHLPHLARLRPRLPARALAEAATAGLVAYVATCAERLSPVGRLEPATLAEHFLFTFLAAVIDRERAHLFGVGDGVFCLNDADLIRLPAGPHNAPPYAAYRLLDLDADADAGVDTSAKVHLDLPTREVDLLLIGTDGAADLQPASATDDVPDLIDELTRESRYLRNPTLAQRRLVALSQRRGPPRLFDDTSLVSIRRRGNRR